MDLNLRQAVIQRMQNRSTEELSNVITGSIGADEKVLPGLGVIFEIIWQNSGEELQGNLVSTLHEHLPQ